MNGLARRLGWLLLSFACAAPPDGGEVASSRQPLTRDEALRKLAPPSLKTARVERPSQLSKLVRDEAAAVALGKAFFWDVQVGSDGRTACATCHHHAGADSRRSGTVHPGADGRFGVSGALSAAAFPFHRRADPFDGRSAVTFDVDDAVGSGGIQRRRFRALVPGSAEELGDLLPDLVFGADRQVTPRNAPSVINAAFNFRSFWDGRASFYFNGVNPFGPSDANARVWVDDGLGMRPERLLLDHASLASQAVGPPVSSVEMAWEGRTMPMLGRKLLGLRPLARQRVHPEDGVLGPYAHPIGTGLSESYGELIARAFHPRYWQSSQTTPEGLPIVEANFALFWGVSLMLYQATLVSDDAPFDRWAEGDDGALTEQQKEGLSLFFTMARCGGCHSGPELTSASVRETSLTELPVRRMMQKTAVAIHDTGFFNIAVRHAAEDVGLGADDPFGRPLSFARHLAARGVGDLAAVMRCRADPSCARAPAGSVLGVPMTLYTELPLAIRGAFKTPTLRNVELTGPYMHNGSMATLRQVIELYARGGNFASANADAIGTELELVAIENVSDAAALEAFLRALTDERVRFQRAPFDHPELPLPDGTVLPAVGRHGGPPLETFEESLPP